MVLKEPLVPAQATGLVKRIAREGTVSPTKHAVEEMAADGMSTGDCLNVLRCGAVVQPPDLERGTWRYRVRTNLMTVVVAFRSESEVSIVTVWRNKK